MSAPVYDLNQIERLRRTMRRLALIVALATGLSIPLGFFTISFHDLIEDMEHHADMAGEQVSEYAYAHGATWSYGGERLQEIIAHGRTLHGDLYQAVSLPDGQPITHHGHPPSWPSASISHYVVVASGVIATISVSKSLLPLFLHTGLVAIFALILGGSVYGVMHLLPLRALDRTLAQLQDSLKSIEAHATETTYAYDELKRQHRLVEETTQELMRARDQAETADRTKSAFLATMSHELRTPLNAIIGFSEMLTQEVFGPLGSTRYKDYCQSICESGRHLLSVINDVLDISKIEAGKLELHCEEVDLPELLEFCARLVRSKVLEGGVELEVVPTREALPVISADPVKLKQVVLNLLSNALKFTPQGGKVSLAASTGGDNGVTLRVSDTGIGMTEEELEVALQPFQQVDNSHTRKYEGTGLGLPLAKGLVEQHGGVLNIESQSGRGTCVSIWLPLGRPAETGVARSAGPRAEPPAARAVNG